MKKKNYIPAILMLTIFTSSVFIDNLSYKVPTQTLKLYELLGDTSNKKAFTIKEFEISNLVKYSEYKVYLNSINKDSSEKFYLTQLPDTNITIDKAVYLKYLNSNEYDKYPVLGISWDNAMNYCKWKTIMDNPKNKISFIYRLPHCSEWLAAINYLNKNGIKNDFNLNYSDWLFDANDESSFSRSDIKDQDFIYDYVYFHSQDDHKILKRKLVIGNSYLYQQEKYLSYSFSFYANQGYRQISFRYIKEYVTPDNKKSNANCLLKIWNLK